MVTDRRNEEWSVKARIRTGRDENRASRKCPNWTITYQQDSEAQRGEGASVQRANASGPRNSKSELVKPVKDDVRLGIELAHVYGEITLL